MKNIFKRGMSALSAAALAASMSAVVPVTASADTIPTETQQFLQNMGAGWVLGNTFDATSAGLSAETSWQTDKTTEAAIKAVHAAGFNTIRIPVSWSKHMSGDYVIDEAWMARVHEVVDWAYNDGMYVILNIHHDNLSESTANNKFGFYPDTSHKDKGIAYVNAVWSQLSAEYQDYGERLIFETLNEPRLCGTNAEWDANKGSSYGAIDTIDALNQSAVDTIRATGGNNAARYIICPGYSASISGAKLASMPSDPGNSGKIIRSIHCYDPYDFCLGSDTDHTSAKATSYTDSTKNSLKYSFDAYKQLADSGIPICIDEMGVSDKENEESRSKWAADAFKFSKDYNMPCVLWDNNAKFESTVTKGWSEHHRHLNRANGKWMDPKVINAIMDSMGVQNRTVTPDDSWSEKKTQTITVSKTSYSKTYGDADFSLNATASGGGALSYTSSSLAVATANNSGKVTIKGVGTATITITAAETAQYTSATKQVTINVKAKAITPTIDAIPDQEYTGSEIKPAIKVRGDNKILSKGLYDVEYKNNVQPGTATVTVTLKDKYTGSAKTTFNIIGEIVKPDKVKIKSVSTGAASAKVSWAEAANAVGYEVSRYDGTSKKFTVVGTTSDLYFKDTGLKAAAVYKYRVRAYNMVNNTKAWGAYSDVKSVLTKPKNTKITKVVKSKTAVKLTWKKVGCTGYQVQKYNASKKKWVTVKTIKGAKNVSYKITKLKKNTAYKFRVRAYKKSGSMKSYSAWAKKTVRTKK